MTIKTLNQLVNVELNDIVSWKSKFYGTRLGRVIKIIEYIDKENKEHRYISCETVINREPNKTGQPSQEVVGNITRFWLV